MSQWEVRFSWQGKQYVEVIRCSGMSAAVDAVKARYPGAYIGSVRRII